MENIFIHLLSRHFINMPIALVNSIDNMYLIFLVTKIMIMEQTSRQEQISSKEELLHDLPDILPSSSRLWSLTL